MISNLGLRECVSAPDTHRQRMLLVFMISCSSNQTHFFQQQDICVFAQLTTDLCIYSAADSITLYDGCILRC